MIFLLYLIKVTFCFCVMYSAYLLVLRKNTFYSVQRLYLLLVPVFALCIPLIPSSSTEGRLTQSTVLRELVIYLHEPPVNQTSVFSWEQLLTLIYFAGLCLVFARLLSQVLRILKLTRTAVYIPKWKVRLVEQPGFRGAASFYNVIILDKPYQSHADPLIIEHEKVHIAQRHWLDVLFAQIFLALTWFNPLSYHYARSLKILHEFIADREVCRSKEVIKHYQSVLVSECFINPLPIHSFSKPSLLKTRIMKINQKPSSKLSLLAYTSLIPVIGLLIVACFSVSATSPDRMKVLQLFQDTGIVFNRVEHNPEYPGGEATLLNDLATYLRDHYPAEAKKKNLHGRVTVNFIVEMNGSVSTIKVLRGNEIGGGLSEAAINAVKALKSFKPGMQNGKHVRVSFSVPVLFKLDNNKRLGSFKGITSPGTLYLLDNKEITNAQLEALKSDRIASMQVLKGKRSTTKYGVKGQNGVIEITSKY